MTPACNTLSRLMLDALRPFPHRIPSFWSSPTMLAPPGIWFWNRVTCETIAMVSIPPAVCITPGPEGGGSSLFYLCQRKLPLSKSLGLVLNKFKFIGYYTLTGKIKDGLEYIMTISRLSPILDLKLL